MSWFDVKVQYRYDLPYVSVEPDKADTHDPDLNKHLRDSVERAKEAGWAVLKSAAEKVQGAEAVVRYKKVRVAHDEALRKFTDVSERLKKTKGQYWSELQTGKDNPKTTAQINQLEAEREQMIRRCRDLNEVLERLRPVYEGVIQDAVETARSALRKKVLEDKKRVEGEIAEFLLKSSIPLAIAEALDFEFGTGWRDGWSRYLEDLPESLPSDPLPESVSSDPVPSV
jgi:hypothetical protein